MTTAERIKIMRKKLKLTKKALAELIGVHESSISKYESGNVEIPISKIKKLAKVLNVSEVWLLCLENEGNPESNEIDYLIENLKEMLNTQEEVTFKGEPIGEYYKCYFFEVLNILTQLIVDRQVFVKMLEKMNKIEPIYQVVESDPEYQHAQAKKDVEELFRKTFEDRII